MNAVTFRNSADHGPMLENLVFMHLRRNARDVEYVTTSVGCETDFLVRDPRTGDRQLIQVCWDISVPKTLDREIRCLKSAMNDLHVTTATIVTWDDQAELDAGIRVTPIWKYLLEEEARGEG